MAIYITSFIVFLAATGILLYQGTKKTVALTLDGKEQVVTTHASTIQDLLQNLKISVSKNDYLYPAGDTKITDKTEVTWKPAKEITVIDGSVKKAIWTTKDTVGEFLEEQKIQLRNEDKVSSSLDTTIKNDMDVSIERAFPLQVVDGGKPTQVWSTSATVADFLKQQGINMQPLDRVEPSLETQIKPNSVVNVVRVQKVTDVVEEPVKYKVISQKDSSLPRGNEKVVTEGKEGLVSNQYEIIKENGKEVKKSLKATKVVRASQDKVVAVGTKVINDTVSRGEATGGRELTVTATAYTAFCNGCSGLTATGFDLRNNPNAKIIAVDPSVIPLGTKVYVEGYGYAIAADTGGAIKGNKIDIFFSSKSRAYQWGRKQVKIRIL
ncbi:G5 and 3D domain-containing protein [Bacillus massiliigorillae]|uniref:ubiquitin-like domain-containing protein n=1 Tax=Bacillus massiliigorillae TaxID=1243664 RepID=UPI0005A8E513|nr:G5 and 3D domain-containing protein [Bacillus massiliigorillae]